MRKSIKIKKVKKPPCAVCVVFDILCTRSPERVTLIFEKWQMEIKENCNVYRDERVFKTNFLLSVYGRTTDALASGGDEGRGRLR